MEPSEETKRDRETRRTDINLDCRFYENRYPNEGDYVKVQSDFSDSALNCFIESSGQS